MNAIRNLVRYWVSCKCCLLCLLQGLEKTAGKQCSCIWHSSVHEVAAMHLRRWWLIGLSRTYKLPTKTFPFSVICGACGQTQTGTKALKKCSGCGVLRYCCSECQEDPTQTNEQAPTREWCGARRETRTSIAIDTGKILVR